MSARGYVFRSTEGLRRYLCPFCGLVLLCEDASSTIRHEDPQCEAFAKKMQTFGLAPVAADPTIFVSPGKGPSS